MTAGAVAADAVTAGAVAAGVVAAGAVTAGAVAAGVVAAGAALPPHAAAAPYLGSTGGMGSTAAPIARTRLMPPSGKMVTRT